MITETQKEDIVRAMEHYIACKNISRNKFSQMMGFSPSYTSALINRNWNEMYAGGKKVVIKDNYFEDIARKIDYHLKESDWGHFDTINYSLITDVLDESRQYKMVMAVDGPTGIGKTYTIQSYLKKNPRNTYVVECAGDFTAKRLIVETARAVGENVIGVTTDLRLAIVKRLSRGNDPLLIIDEAENLKDGAWQSVKKMMDDLASATNRRCGIVLFGANNFRHKMEQKAIRMKEPFPQVHSRIKEGGYCTLLEMIYSDKTDILDKLGIHSPEVKKRINDRCDNMREIYGAVTKLRREQRITNEPIEDLVNKVLA